MDSKRVASRKKKAKGKLLLAVLLVVLVIVVVALAVVTLQNPLWLAELTGHGAVWLPVYFFAVT